MHGDTSACLTQSTGEASATHGDRLACRELGRESLECSVCPQADPVIVTSIFKDADRA